MRQPCLERPALPLAPKRLLLRRLTRVSPRRAVSQPAVVTLLAFGFVGLWATAGILKARADRGAGRCLRWRLTR